MNGSTLLLFPNDLCIRLDLIIAYPSRRWSEVDSGVLTSSAKVLALAFDKFVEDQTNLHGHPPSTDTRDNLRAQLCAIHLGGATKVILNGVSSNIRLTETSRLSTRVDELKNASD